MEDESVLLHLIAEREYQEAMDYVNTNPHVATSEAAFILLCNSTHANSEETAVELARLMLQLNPDLARYRDEDGVIALHCCVDIKAGIIDGRRTSIPRSAALAILLINSYPEGVNVAENEISMTPFYWACEANAEFAVLKAMLEVNPSLAAQEFTFETPLEVLWEVNKPIIDDRMMLILLTTLKGHVMDPLPTEHLVHAACNYRCPPDFYLKLFEADIATQQQLTMRDDQGKLPLHYAVQPSFLENEHFDEFNHYFREDDLTDLVSSLLDMSPETASMTDREGLLPLFIALRNLGLSWVRGVILKVAEAYPQALHRRDSEHKLFPFLLAAMRANESTEHLSVTYELLLKTPEMILRALERNVSGNGDESQD
jgi:ankyrin repeat protein